MRRFLYLLIGGLGLLTMATQAWASEPAAPRIATLAPNLTELVFSVGAGDQLVATVEYSDYPQAALKVPRVGDAFTLDEERLLALRPDLVLAWASGTPTARIERLRSLGLKVETISISKVDDVAKALLQIGEWTHHSAEAARQAQAFRQHMSLLRQRYQSQRPLTVFIQVGNEPLYTVSGAHLISQVVELCGGRNVFASLSQIAAPVSVESVLQKQPEAIIAATQDTSALLRQWAPWQALTAVGTSRVYAINEDLLTRATPRLTAAATQVCESLQRGRAVQIQR